MSKHTGNKAAHHLTDLYLSLEVLDVLLGSLQLSLEVLLLQPQLLQLGLMCPVLPSSLQAGDQPFLGLVEGGSGYNSFVETGGC